MNSSEYRLLNRVVVFVTAAVLFILVFYVNEDTIKCIQLDRTGIPCTSCGMTRDFKSFLQFDFENPINDYSWRVFLFLWIQFFYRTIMSILDCPKPQLNNIIKFDIIISVVLAMTTFSPFLL